MRSVIERVLVIATALPARSLARGAAIADRHDLADRLRRRAVPVPTVALIATAPAWLLAIVRGVLYPLFGAGNLEHSWGGPTLIGAWATHLLVAIAALLVVSLLVALATRSSHPQAADAAVHPR